MFCRNEFEKQIYQQVFSGQIFNLEDIIQSPKTIDAVINSHLSLICENILSGNERPYIDSFIDQFRKIALFEFIRLPIKAAKENRLAEAIAILQKYLSATDSLNFKVLTRPGQIHLDNKDWESIHRTANNFIFYLIENNYPAEIFHRVIKECKLNLESIVNYFVQMESPSKILTALQTKYSVATDLIISYCVRRGKFQEIEQLSKEPEKALTTLIQNFQIGIGTIKVFLMKKEDAENISSSLTSDTFWKSLRTYTTLQQTTANKIPNEWDNLTLSYDINQIPLPSYFKFQRTYQYSEEVCLAWLNQDVRNWFLFCAALTKPHSETAINGNVPLRSNRLTLTMDLFLIIGNFIYPGLSANEVNTLRNHKFMFFLFHDLNQHAVSHPDDQKKIEVIKEEIRKGKNKDEIYKSLIEHRNIWFHQSSGNQEPPLKKQKNGEVPEFFAVNEERLSRLH